ncbi:MAG: UDP-N-acetylglucosamine 1-carboxyvinyltransferase, partial [Thermosulfidibacteraceae bacterium]
KDVKEPFAPYDLVRTMRASVLVLGPLIARCGFAKVSMPGGCAIGERPINLHLRGFETLGAVIDIDSGYVIAKVEGKLTGNRYVFEKVTVTGTENVIMAASLSEGETVLVNVAEEPEVVELIDVLRKMGAEIEEIEPRVLRISGKEKLGGFRHRVMPDRIEAATFIIASTMVGECVDIIDVKCEHLEAVLEKLKECGARFESIDRGLKVYGAEKILARDVETAPYPGFPTDVQAQYMAMMTIAEGVSIITETIFEKRFMHAAELRRMGADIVVEGQRAIVKGVKELKGAPLMASDLRASASLVIAALAARGVSKISRLYHLDRGYEKFDEKLRSLGARVWRVKE